jgi:hypothetical protein
MANEDSPPILRDVDPDKRCESCEHYYEYHQPDGCWFCVVVGRINSPIGCACGVGVARD